MAAGAKMARYAGIGLEFASPIVVGSIVGHYIDEYLKTDPWFTLVMFLSGTFLGFYRLFREVQAAQRAMK